MPEPERLEAQSVREALGLDPRHGVYVADLARSKQRRKPYRKTNVKRPRPKAVPR